MNPKRPLMALMSLIVLLYGLTATAQTLKVALDSDPKSLDSHIELSGSMLRFSNWIFDPLVRWDKDLGFEPRLAVRWEKTDALTMRFFLRKDVQKMHLKIGPQMHHVGRSKKQ